LKKVSPRLHKKKGEKGGEKKGVPLSLQWAREKERGGKKDQASEGKKKKDFVPSIQGERKKGKRKGVEAIPFWGKKGRDMG